MRHLERSRSPSRPVDIRGSCPANSNGSPSPAACMEPQDHAVRRTDLGTGPEMIKEVLETMGRWPRTA